MSKTTAEAQREYRARLKEQGIVSVSLFCPEGRVSELRALVAGWVAEAQGESSAPTVDLREQINQVLQEVNTLKETINQLKLNDIHPPKQPRSSGGQDYSQAKDIPEDLLDALKSINKTDFISKYKELPPPLIASAWAAAKSGKKKTAIQDASRPYDTRPDGKGLPGSLSQPLIEAAALSRDESSGV
jgi:hypothetical protein